MQSIAFTENHTNLKDRSKWGKGEWDNEPSDKLVWVDKETELDCMMVRNHAGAWCGYVGVKPSHFLFGVDYNELSWGVFDVHGGLTYSDACQGHICHTTEDEDHVHWFGFDCFHNCDQAPAGESDLLDILFRPKGDGKSYCNQTFVIGQVTSLAKQIANYTKEEFENQKEEEEDSW